MGDNYYLKNIECAYCGKKQKEYDVVYSPEFDNTFRCKWCKKKNKMIMDIKAVKIEKPKGAK